MSTFRDYINENINKSNFKTLEKFMQKQPGFKSFEIKDEKNHYRI